MQPRSQTTGHNERLQPQTVAGLQEKYFVKWVKKSLKKKHGVADACMHDPIKEDRRITKFMQQKKGESNACTLWLRRRLENPKIWFLKTSSEVINPFLRIRNSVSTDVGFSDEDGELSRMRKVLDETIVKRQILL